jgi:hypothetical protein
MPPGFTFLFALALVGLLFLAAVYYTPATRTRQIIFWLGLVIVNLGALFVIFAVFLVSRLEGSTPPGILEVLSPYWLPILLIVLEDGAIIGASRRGTGNR